MEKKKHNKKKIIIITSSITGFFLVVILACLIYMIPYNHATDSAMSYMKNSDSSQVIDKNDYTLFKPKENEDDKKVGLIFYPGGKVGNEAYAPMLRTLSDNGITSILVKMPFHLAILDGNGADNKQALASNVTSWYIGGHSLGGLMASSYISKHSDSFLGLILLAAYSNIDLSSYTNLKTLSFTASNDKVLNYDNYYKYESYLPNHKRVDIDGGIHSYFGDYGIQKGDGTPTITVEEQRSKVCDEIVSYVI